MCLRWRYRLSKPQIWVLSITFLMAVLLIFLLLNIKALSNITAKPGIDLPKTLKNKGKIALYVQIDNPSFIPFVIEGYEFELKADKELSHIIKSNKKQKIGIRSKNKVPLDFRPEFSLLQLYGLRNKTISIKGQVKLKVLFIKLEYPMEISNVMPSLPSKY